MLDAKLSSPYSPFVSLLQKGRLEPASLGDLHLLLNVER